MSETSGVITLRAGCAAVGIAPAIGGSITHYHWIAGKRRHDWMRPSSPADQAAHAAGRLSCFPLVPFSNRIRRGRFVFRGRAIQLPRNHPPVPHALHGHGFQREWSVSDCADGRLALTYEHAADAWPFPYRARQDFLLAEEQLSITLSVENRGHETMPVGLGLHPYFPRTAGCRLKAQVGAMWATDAEVMPTALVDSDPRLARGDGLPISEVELDNGFTLWRREAAIFWPEAGARLAIEASPPLDFLVVYAPRGDDFFCVEPASHCTDAFNLAAQGRADTGMLTLDPGASVSATVRFRPSLANR